MSVYGAEFTYDDSTTVLAYAILAGLAFGVLRLFWFGVQVGLAACYAKRGRSARVAELAAWAAYYDQVEMERTVTARAAKKKDEIDGELKRRIEVLQADLAAKNIARTAYVAAKQSEEQLAADLKAVEDQAVADEQKLTATARDAAEQATRTRLWYVERTVREWVMSVDPGKEWKSL